MQMLQQGSESGQAGGLLGTAFLVRLGLQPGLFSARGLAQAFGQGEHRQLVAGKGAQGATG